MVWSMSEAQHTALSAHVIKNAGDTVFEIILACGLRSQVFQRMRLRGDGIDTSEAVFRARNADSIPNR
jgi:hypothetical protein